ncbi:hypothetical protein EWI07_01295 [Sporolactobacillus sp. THM7-4]|nr:hypothetical protein EWI07_01295 [Sporolactobacillus sp. THM7-4]
MLVLEKDMDRLPSDADMKYAFEQTGDKERARDRENEYKEEIERLLNTKKREAGLLKNKLSDLTTDDRLPLDADAYKNAEKRFTEYQDAFDDFKTRAANLNHQYQVIHLLEESNSSKQDEFEELFQEVNERRVEWEKQKRNLTSVEERLKLKNAEDVQKRLEAVIQDLAASSRHLPEVTKAAGSTEAAIRQLEGKIGSLKIQTTFFEQLKLAWEETFRTEYQSYLPKEGSLQNPEAIVRSMLKDFKLDIERKKRLLSDFENKFREVYGSLPDYRLEINDRKMIQEGEWTRGEWPSDLLPLLEQWQDLTHQRLFECDYQGAKATPSFVISKLDEYINQQSVFLEAQDQKLFEDIIYHSVGITLRSLIDRSEKWVKQMNEILVGQDNSSDLTLSIAWKAKAAETEEQLDTRELVSLLRRDAQLLSQEDLEKMIRHFRAKIESSKRRMLDKDNNQSLDQVLKEVLDYRQWFTFELSYKRKNESKKELTNYRFYKFSGGEKAVAMYLPLYTAVYARYQDAGKNAPYIIALDEAFAGVDELNIAEQFKAIEQLGFNYMMNSQALFGDYETVPALNIYELIRPKNANYVSMIAYHWNGKQRQLIHEEDEAILENNS